MLTNDMIEFQSGNDAVFGVRGVGLVWIIDEECLFDMPIIEDYADIFRNCDEVIDISDEYPDYDGIVVRFMKNGEVLEELKTTEYFGSILLSEPLVLRLTEWPYGRYVMSPNAKFDGEKFIITNRNVTNLPAWHPKNPNTPEGYFESFAQK
jgi:hypothetical protein